MERIGMFDAKTRFSEIVRRVRRTGKPVTITNRGEEVVRIVPVTADPADREMTRQEAIEAVHELWKTLPPITHEEIRSAIDEGRR